MTVDVVIHGAGGRVGREVARMALGDADVRLAGCLDRPDHPLLGTDIGAACGAGACDVLVCASPSDVPLNSAVVIDFSSPAATMALADAVGAKGRGLVVGTTGLDREHMERLEQSARHMPVLVSPNMSLGVNLLFHLTDLVTRRLGSSFDIEIIETHHRHKKDSPSGTARRLGEIAAAARSLNYEEAAVHGRHGMVGERTGTEIGVHAVRGGDIVGEHVVLFAGEGERVELRHTAHSRANFAAGAVAAAKWLWGRAPGMYSMGDVLGI